MQLQRQRRSLANLSVQKQQRHPVAAAERRRSARSLQLHPDGMCDNPPSSSSVFITSTMTCIVTMASLIQVRRS